MSRRSLAKAAAADLLGISAKQLERYVAEGIPHEGTGAKRRFPWPEIRHWRDRKIAEIAKAEVTRSQDATDISEAERRKKLAEARLKEIELAKEEAHLLPLEVHEARVAALCDRLAGRVKGLGRYLGDVQRAMTDIEAATLLERMSDELLRALSETADEIEEEAAPPTADESAA